MRTKMRLRTTGQMVWVDMEEYNKSEDNDLIDIAKFPYTSYDWFTKKSNLRSPKVGLRGI